MKFCDVSFAYRRTGLVLDQLTWSVPDGVTVLLGPNGAGKSTSLALAASVRRPQRGQIQHAGLTTSRAKDLAAWRRQVGWVPQDVTAIPGFTVHEQVEYAGWLKGLRRRSARRKALETLDVVGLVDRAGQTATTLSGGQLRRLGIAAALVHDAELLVLDEPTAGLDPAQRARLRRYLDRLRGGCDVLISTHQIDDLKLVADSVAVMRAGRIVFTGPTNEFLDLGTPTAGDTSPTAMAETAYAHVTGTEL